LPINNDLIFKFSKSINRQLEEARNNKLFQFMHKEKGLLSVYILSQLTFDIIKSFYVIGELFVCTAFHCKKKLMISSNLLIQKPLMMPRKSLILDAIYFYFLHNCSFAENSMKKKCQNPFMRPLGLKSHKLK